MSYGQRRRLRAAPLRAPRSQQIPVRESRQDGNKSFFPSSIQPYENTRGFAKNLVNPGTFMSVASSVFPSSPCLERAAPVPLKQLEGPQKQGSQWQSRKLQSVLPSQRQRARVPTNRIGTVEQSKTDPKGPRMPKQFTSRHSVNQVFKLPHVHRSWGRMRLAPDPNSYTYCRRRRIPIRWVS